MNVEYRDNPQRGPGYGLLAIDGVKPAEGEWNVAIQRGSDQRYLTGKTANQWTEETYFLPLAGVPAGDGKLLLGLGPEIVDSLDPQEQYRVSIKRGDTSPARARLKLKSVTYSPAASLNNMAASPHIPDEKKKPTSPPMPEKAAQTPVREPTPLEKPAGESAEELQMPEAAASKGHHKWIRYAILALLALACMAWYFLDPGIRDGKKAENEKTVEIEKSQPPAASAPAQSPVMGKSTAAKSGTEESVRQFFIGGNITPAAAAELARGLSAKTASEQDAIYRLYYFAAENGEPGALIEYATCLDPAKAQWGTIQKDAVMADEVYKKAIEHNLPGAVEARKAMRGWLESQAQSGNAAARAWLMDLTQ